MALEAGEVELLTPIRMRYTGEVIDLTNAYDDQDVSHTEPIQLNKQFLHTTVGRVIFNDHLPSDMPFVNGLLKKKGIQALVQYCYLRFGLEKTVLMLDQAEGTRLPLRNESRRLHQHQRHGHPGREIEAGRHSRT